jgi:molecular chaperone GrpE
MAFEFLKKRLLSKVFVIDEPRQEVYWDETKSARSSQDREGEDATVTARLPWEIRSDDLLSEVSRLMIEQVRLEQKAKMLESGGRGDDEFAKFARQLLPFLDNYWRLLEMARQFPPSDDLKNWLSGIESLYYRVVRLLEEHDLVFINSLGKKVNLDYHEVVEYRVTKDYPNNQVIKELERGVVFRNRLLRDAKVVVAHRPA